MLEGDLSNGQGGGDDTETPQTGKAASLSLGRPGNRPGSFYVEI